MRAMLKKLVLGVQTMLPEKILQSIKKVHYARRLRYFSESDEVDFQVIRHLVNPGDHVVDIGANIGIYTKYLSGISGYSRTCIQY
jgi:hypothetical protein